jgi:hypothetical protein
MASSSTDPSKVLCVVCNKAKGIYKCEGCSRIFCPKHSIDHRNELGKQLEEIEVTHDLAQQTLIQQAEDPQQHPLLKKINQWEEESIVKIRQTAEKVRSELLNEATQHTTQVKQKLKILSDELRQGRDDNDFSEIDLKQWMQKLDQLRSELLDPDSITIREDSTPLVTNIRIDRQGTSSDVFERVCGTAQITENGRLVLKDGSSDHTEIRGKREYISGQHILRFQVELFSGDAWIFFGIVSKTEPMKVNSYSSLSTYGWATHNQTYIAGQIVSRRSGDAKQNDIITLLIDCDQRKIELNNERSGYTMEMPVDITKCPFPWQFHLNLHAQNTRVRILS